MRILLTSTLIGMALIVANAQTKNNYTLAGTFKGLPDKTKSYLVTAYGDTIQSTISKNNVVKFVGTLPLNGQFHFIHFDTSVSKIYTSAIFLENTKIEVTGEIGSSIVVVSGSGGHDDYLKVKTLQAFWYKKLEPFLRRQMKNDTIIALASMNGDSTSKKLKDAEADQIKLKAEMNVIGWGFSNAVADWCKANRSSLYAPYTIKISILKPDAMGISEKDRERDLKLSKSVFFALNDNARNGYYGKDLGNTLADMKYIETFNQTEVKYIANIELKDEKGNTKKLHDVISKNKITLIDCWASWCKPCRAEIPALKKIYDQYKSKEFGIIGISSDKNRSKWLEALSQENLPWTSLIEDNSSLIRAYNIQSIPAYILVDSKGKILAYEAAFSAVKNFGGKLRGERLPTTLDKYF